MVTTTIFIDKGNRDLPCGSVVKNLPCNAGNSGLIPVRGTKILYAAWHGQKREKIDMQERSL